MGQDSQKSADAVRREHSSNTSASGNSGGRTCARQGWNPLIDTSDAKASRPAAAATGSGTGAVPRPRHTTRAQGVRATRPTPAGGRATARHGSAHQRDSIEVMAGDIDDGGAGITAESVAAQLAAVDWLLRGGVPGGGGGVGMGDDDRVDEYVADLAVVAHKAAIEGGRDPNESIGDVSLHSSDFADEELLQGLRDLDNELEEEHQMRVVDLVAEIAARKEEAVRLLKEEGDKSAALRELQAAKRLEAELAALEQSHVPPVSVRMETLAARIATLEETMADRKQASLAALRAGEKPTALELLKEAKEVEKQLEELRAQHAELEVEKDNLLRSTG